jgi:glycosyltransferase involved in cell wall biosynthesis
MRVGYLTYGLDRAPTGIGRYAVELLRALAALPRAPEIVLLTTEREDHHGLWECFERQPLPGCRLLPGLLTTGNLLLSAAVWRHRLAVVHDPNGIAPLLGPRLGARRVVTVHDAFGYVCPEAHNRLDNWRYRAMLPRALAASDAVLTDSEHSRKDLVRYLGLGQGKVRAVHLGIDPRFRPVSDGLARRAALARYGVAGWPYVLYTGGINARKNIARLLEAFALLTAEGPAPAGLRLVIAGKRQWVTDEIDATLRRINLGERVHFTGYVADEDLPALYSAAELFVFPSLYEGFGLPPLEAMACGTPSVVSAASSLPEVVGDAALLVDPTDVAAIAALMGRVLSASPLAADLRARGMERARRFSWERTARETAEIYRRVAGAA